MYDFIYTPISPPTPHPVSPRVCVCLQMCVGVFECGPHEDHLNGKRCCTLCPPGLGVITPCSPDNNTVCQPCVDGKTFSPGYSHIDICRPCRPCQMHSHMTYDCNVTHNTACQCDWNYFLDAVTQACRPCSTCPLGFGVRHMCNATHDTQCTHCPPGTYSDLMTSRGGCVVCRVCATHQVSLQACSYRQNTVCVGECFVDSVACLFNVMFNSVVHGLEYDNSFLSK